MSVKSIKQIDLVLPEADIEETQPSFSYSCMLTTRQSLRIWTPTFESPTALKVNTAFSRNSNMLDDILSRLTGERAATSSGYYWTKKRIDNESIWRWLSEE